MRRNDSAINHQAQPPLLTARSLWVSVACGIGANLVWGLAFLLPVIVAPTDSVTLAIGRYLCFGAVSLGILIGRRGRMLTGVGAREWRQAGLFSLTGHFGYYLLLVLGILLAGPTIATVIIGVLPVSVALTGSWIRREFAVSRLVLPLALIAVGLAVVYAIELDWGSGSGRSDIQVIAGVGATVLALALWTSYAVMNARFLRDHPSVSSTSWSTLMGVCALGWGLAALPLAAVAGGMRPADPGPVLVSSVVLGVVVSWFGTVLWNRASAILPVSIAGQMVVLQVMAGLAYVFVWEARLPPLIELLGMALLIAGVLVALQRTRT
ncbi:DMT family transporter [Leifsonia sp. NPDC056824]|uniref:DMT family transporter n=1 Tax=Leifsonia sp. NPDC056824 TaxID=3345953 RepID=UPI0036B58CEC